ncbi:hypothetical protein Cs7R123_27660 [Catellatospora sp. TT07R-123]|uniref:hypothetical protein n=1 Tax=Catellatospora sp. TT07R-123 TaxID=2733863 RepID=UPI001B1A1A4E|nr:hypothetical protein [Catellatospora sp. TT07R-123]GHJ45424.1 hypothetical protein Cs7R123_27660 [Catellatospora sp. TT07R-123]
MTTRKHLTRTLLAATLLGGLLAGCARTGTAEPNGTPTGEASVSSAPSPGAGTPKPPKGGPSIPPPARDEITVTGTVEHVDLEGGCTVLRASGKTYELMGGDRDVITPGARLTVTGRIRTDIATICQMGPVLEVISAQPS